MKKYIYFLLFIMLSFGTAYADNKKDLFDDYGIYTKEMFTGIWNKLFCRE